MRNAECVKQEYENLWNSLTGTLLAILESGEKDLRSAVIELDYQMYKKSESSYIETYKHYRPVLFDQEVFIDDPETFLLISTNMLYSYIGSLFTISNEFNFERIVDLGSGWGRSIFNIYLNGAPKNADYYSLEMTESGRLLSRFLATLEPEMKHHTEYFDFYNPDFSCLNENRKTLVLTAHAIEQITLVKESLFEAILNIPGLTHGIHIEPVGWQMTNSKTERNYDHVKEYQIKHNYNQNLCSVLNSLVERNLITIEQVLKDVYGFNPLNPSTLIIWKKNDNMGITAPDV